MYDSVWYLLNTILSLLTSSLFQKGWPYQEENLPPSCLLDPCRNAIHSPCGAGGTRNPTSVNTTVSSSTCAPPSSSISASADTNCDRVTSTHNCTSHDSMVQRDLSTCDLFHEVKLYPGTNLEFVNCTDSTSSSSGTSTPQCTTKGLKYQEKEKHKELGSEPVNCEYGNNFYDIISSKDYIYTVNEHQASSTLKGLEYI